MTLQDDPRLRQILDTAADLPREDRPEFLDKTCGGDAALRAEIAKLLDSLDRAGKFLEDPTVGFVEPAHRVEIGSRIGPYRLLKNIGEGGMGVVYLAEQEEGVRRQVALKIIKLGLDTKQVIARFEAERQALAMMNHPNIAAVLDAGATESGRPYFVMELVRGLPITDFCDKNHLTTRQRLRLFIMVCAAVQHAHQKGIIHRDIKPSNVLVTVHDGAAVPKVIDFGIAKATSGRLTDKTLITERMHFLGTPEYMSPEQASPDAQDVDTRADIYALGVLLYKLLTGTTPIESQTLRGAAYEEVHRLICDVEPPKPSTRLGTLDDKAVTQAAMVRKTDPDKLQHQVRGELDWIVMKCLEKDRTRRYESAGGLGKDLLRHLKDEPVEASPPSRMYQLRKLCRKHRRSLQVAAAFMLLLAAAVTLGVIGIVIDFRRVQAEQRRTLNALDDVRNQRSEAEHQREIAQARFDDVRELAHKAIFDVDYQLASLPGAQPARKALVQTALDYLNKVAPDAGNDESLSRDLADGYFRIADIQKNLGDSAGRELSARTGFAIYKRLYQAHSDDPQWQGEMATEELRMANFLGDWGNGPGSLELRESAQAILEPLVKRDPNYRGAQEALAWCYSELGNDWNGQDSWDKPDDLKKSIDYLDKSLDLRRSFLSIDPDNQGYQRDVAVVLEGIASTQGHLGETAEQLKTLRQVQPIFQKLTESNPSAGAERDLAWNYIYLGQVLEGQGDPVQALQNFQAALPLLQKIADPDPTNAPAQRSVGMAHSLMGDAYRDMNQFSKALEAYGEALPIRKQLFLKDPEEIDEFAGTYQHMGEMCQHMGDEDGAIENYLAEWMTKYRLKDETPTAINALADLSTVYGDMADKLVEMGDEKRALEYFDKRLAIARKIYQKSQEKGMDMLSSLQSQFAGDAALQATIDVKLSDTYRTLGRNGQAPKKALPQSVASTPATRPAAATQP